MRSRYCAYTLGNSNYLLSTWHQSTRPGALSLENDKTRWSGLTVIPADSIAADETEGTVEFVARCKINGKAGKLHERSHFMKENGRWYYVDGEIKD